MKMKWNSTTYNKKQTLPMGKRSSGFKMHSNSSSVLRRICVCDFVHSCCVLNKIIEKMRTSQTQFEMMVTFMEQHGDLTKPNKNPRGRLTTIQRWDELAAQLNSDGSGDSKSTEKWKKVWSDLKNNTRKKFARIKNAASGTGGGPASTSKLTVLEERVLAIMGELAATGLQHVTEAGLSQNSANEEPVAATQVTPTQTEACTLPFEENEEVYVYAIQEEDEWNRPGSSRQPHVAPPGSPPAPAPVPATEGQSPRRRVSPRRRDLLRRSPRRRPRTQTALQEATQNFISSDEQWRAFRIECHRDKNQNEKERLRLRAIELQVQQQWLEIFQRLLDALQKLVDKYVEKD